MRLALAFLLLAPLALHAGQAQPTNVVVILADDLGYGDLSSYGAPGWTTPRLDRMATEGVRLTDFYVPVPYCAPSRATLLTGRYPFRHGMTRNPAPDGPPALDAVGLDPAEVTLAELFRDAGYATAAIGKWHLGHRSPFFPTQNGFDEYLGILYSNDMRPVTLVEDTTVVEYPVVQATLTRRYTDRAIDFVERQGDRPFFLYLAHAMPHKPLAPSPAFYTPETPGDLYADVVRELDHEVGRLLDRLDALGLGERTLVLFLSDNGPWFGGSTGGLRGMKAQTWEGGLRVPFIARWPGRLPAGRTSAALTASVDVLPTLLAATGLRHPAPGTLDGHNLLPVLADGAPTPHEAVFGMHGAGVRTVRSGRWKLHVEPPNRPGYLRLERPLDWVDPRGPDGVTILGPFEQPKPDRLPGLDTGVAPRRMMLFDLQADPAEQHDVAAQHPEVVGRLHGLWQSVATSSE